MALVLLACWAGHGGCGGLALGVASSGVVGGGSSGRDSGCAGSDLGCCGWLGAGRAVGWAGRWVVAGAFLSIMLYFIIF